MCHEEQSTRACAPTRRDRASVPQSSVTRTHNTNASRRGRHRRGHRTEPVLRNRLTLSTSPSGGAFLGPSPPWPQTQDTAVPSPGSRALCGGGERRRTPVPRPQEGALRGDQADAQGQRHTSTPKPQCWGGAAGAPGRRVLTLTHPALPRKPENQLQRQARRPGQAAQKQPGHEAIRAPVSHIPARDPPPKAGSLT